MAQTYFWKAPAAVTAGVPYSAPADANMPRASAVLAALIMPLVSAATGSQVFETAVASGQGGGTSGAVSAGQVAFNANTQQFSSGDAIASGQTIFVIVEGDGENPINP
jgi:hypothetical protein